MGNRRQLNHRNALNAALIWREHSELAKCYVELVQHAGIVVSAHGACKQPEGAVCHAWCKKDECLTRVLQKVDVP